MKITAVLGMAEVEPSFEFWTQKLGFDVVTTVPDGQKIGFAILQKDGAEVMMQSHASVQKDMAAMLGHFRDSKTALFVEVDDFADMLKRVEGANIAFPVRTTFYGMKEIGVFEPAGHLVVFAARAY